MDKAYYRFLRNLILFTLLSAIVVYFIHFILPTEYLSPTLPYLFVFFFAVTLLVHYMLRKMLAGKATSFIRMFMLLSFGKLFFFLIVIVAYAMIYRADAIAFILNFFLLYILFTAFEVSQSLKAAKGKEKQKTD